MNIAKIPFAKTIVITIAYKTICWLINCKSKHTVNRQTKDKKISPDKCKY